MQNVTNMFNAMFTWAYINTNNKACPLNYNLMKIIFKSSIFNLLSRSRSLCAACERLRGTNSKNITNEIEETSEIYIRTI